MPNIADSPAVALPLLPTDRLYGERNGEAVKEFALGDIVALAQQGVTSTAATWGRVQANGALASISHAATGVGTPVNFNATQYSSGMTFSGTSGIIPSAAGRYRVDFLMMSGSGDMNSDGTFIVVQNGVSVGEVFVDMMQAAGVNQVAPTIDVTLSAGQAVTLNYKPAAADSVPWSGGSYFQLTQISGFVPSTTTVEIADVNGLQPALDGKATSAQGTKADAALPATADAIADVLETAPPADLARIQEVVSGAGPDGLPIFWGAGFEPVRRGVELGCIGDSRTECNTLVSGTNTDAPGDVAKRWQPNGPLTWFLARSGAAVKFKKNAGKSGDTSGAFPTFTGVNARITTDLLPNYTAGTAIDKVCVYMVGINDATSGQAISATNKYHAANLDLLNANGIQVIVVASPSKTGGGAAVTNHMLAQRAYLRTLCEGRRGRVFVDGFSALCNVATGDFLAGVSYDGTHLWPKGAYILGEAINTATTGKFPKLIMPTHAADFYATDPTYTRQWNTNPMLTGTTGTFGTNASGVAATGCTIVGSAGVSAVASKLTADMWSGGAGGQRVVFTATAAGSAQIVLPQITAANLVGLAASDNVILAANYQVTSATNLSAMQMDLTHAGVTPLRYGYWNAEQTAYGAFTLTDLALPDHVGLAQCREVPMEFAASGNMQSRMIVKFSGAGSATIDIGPAALLA